MFNFAVAKYIFTMKKILILLAALTAGITGRAEVVPTDNGAKITVDSLTTEVTVLSPTMVRVIKYIGSRPEMRETCVKHPSLDYELKREAAGGKYKIDAGEYYVALNEKDGNVSFWGHDGNLIMAEQHRTASLVPVGGCADGVRRYVARQDFQIGRSGADSITCPASPAPRLNLKGRRAEFGDAADGLPVPYIVTEKGYGVMWKIAGVGRMDDTPGRQVKKPGDVTFTSDDARCIDYYFIYPAAGTTVVR